jgi:type I restriction enzyme S subunit
MMADISTIVTLLRNGKSVKQSEEAGGVPITRIETIADWTVNPEKVGFADLCKDDCRDWLLQKGDILISHINSTKHLGKCAIYQGEPATLVHGMNLLAMRVNPKVADAQYVYKMLASPRFRSQLPRITKDSVNQSSFNISRFKKLQIPLPPLSEQKRIAAILDAADALRAKRRESLTQLDTLLQSTFLDMFGDPVNNPKGLPKKTLNSIFRFTTGKLDSNAAVDGGKYPFFTCARETFAIDEYAFDCEALLLAGNNANADYSVKHYKGKFNAYQRTYVISVDEKTLTYEYARVVLEYMLADLKRFSKGTNTKYLTMTILNGMPILLPPLSLQRRFAAIVDSVERQKARMRAHLAELDALFASLQSRAFNGEL